MDFCPNCNCDYCYFEKHPDQTPVRPPACKRCDNRVVWGSYHCDECLEAEHQEWLTKIKGLVIVNSHPVSRQDYERMIREAQE
jgi:hypothetical protein